MISISLPLSPTGSRAPGSPAPTAPPGDFALALADMLTIAGLETAPPISPAAPTDRQVAAVPGKSVPVDAAIDPSLAQPTGPDGESAPAASDPVVLSTRAAPITASSQSDAAIGDSPLAVGRDHPPRHDRGYMRRKEALAALPLPIPAAVSAPLAPQKDAGTLPAGPTPNRPEDPRAARDAKQEPGRAADAITTIPTDQSLIPLLIVPVAAVTREPADSAALSQPKHPHPAVAESAPAGARDCASMAAPAPIDPAPSGTGPLRPERFLKTKVDARARMPLAAVHADRPDAAVVQTADAPKPIADTGVPGLPRLEPGTRETRFSGSAIIAPPQARTDTRPTIAAPPNKTQPATKPVDGSIVPPVLARVMLADRPAANLEPRAAPELIPEGVPGSIRAATGSAGALHRRFPAAAAPESETRIAGATPEAARSVPAEAARPAGLRDPAASTVPAPAIRAPASVDVQQATPVSSPAPLVSRAQDGSGHLAGEGATSASIRPAAPVARPISIVPPAAAPIVALFGEPRPISPRAPRAVGLVDAPAGLAGTLATAHTAPPIQPVAEAQRTPLDMRRDDWTQALIDRIDTLRDAANATDTRIRLVPDALGKIDVSMRKDADTVHVTFTADVPATRAMLADAQPKLADLAQQRGLRLGQSSVDAGASGDGQQRQAPAPSTPTRPARASARDEAITETGRVA